MGMPNFTDNYRGYEEGDVTRVVKALKDRKFLVIHGTADERVHYQHTLHLTKALITEGVPFTEQVGTATLCTCSGI
jgi:dipeptidyl aminopeptidase/acylaminoacyl peptidase